MEVGDGDIDFVAAVPLHGCRDDPGAGGSAAANHAAGAVELELAVKGGGIAK